MQLEAETVRKIYIVIQSVFRRGIEQGFVRDNPCHDVILPKNRSKKKKPVLDEKQTKCFLSLLETKKWDKDIKRIFKVLLFTGRHIGECLALYWDDINFDDMTINISKGLIYDNNKRLFISDPKTYSSSRVIGMSEELADIFREQKAYHNDLVNVLGENFEHKELVFPSDRWNYRDRNAVLKSLKRFTANTEFDFLTLHSFRHCNATLLLNNNVGLKIVSEHLGHSDIGITANIYADVLKSTKAMVADFIALKLT